MSKDTGGPAFPHPQGWRRNPEISDGMSLRDYFAAKVMQGMMSIPDERAFYPVEDDKNSRGQTLEEWRQSLYDDDARIAYSVADAMLKARGE